MRAAKHEYTIRLSPFDRLRLEQLAREQGKRPRGLAREILERYLDSAQISKEQQAAA